MKWDDDDKEEILWTLLIGAALIILSITFGRLLLP